MIRGHFFVYNAPVGSADSWIARKEYRDWDEALADFLARIEAHVGCHPEHAPQIAPRETDEKGWEHVRFVQSLPFFTQVG